MSDKGSDVLCTSAELLVLLVFQGITMSCGRRGYVLQFVYPVSSLLVSMFLNGLMVKMQYHVLCTVNHL